MKPDLDAQYMLDFKNGDPDGFRVLFTKYTPKIVNFCYRFCGNRTLAEELAQEVFLRVYKAASRYKPEARFSTWLFRIATNVCLNETRKARYHVVTEEIDAVVQTESGSRKREVADSSIPKPDELLDQKTDVLLVKQVLRQLPRNQRIALLLRVYHEFSYKEIGNQMNQSESAVKSLIHRARQTVIKMIRISNRSQSSEPQL